MNFDPNCRFYEFISIFIFILYLYLFLFLLTRKYGIEVKDFGASWRNGVAFNALIHDVKPHMIDMRVVETSTPRENLERAFETAEQHLGIPRLLDPEGLTFEIHSVIIFTMN